MRGWRCRGALALLLGPLAAGAATEGAAVARIGTPPPPAGLYDAQLCVAVAATPAQCGPVTAQIDETGQAEVRLDDIVYRLQVRGDQLGVALFHGTMQIDGFFARYQWAGTKLAFSDPEKGARYELKLGTRRFAP